MKLRHMPVRSYHPGDIPAFALANNLLAASLTGADWVLYLHLAGLAHHEQANPVSTTVTRLRLGTVQADSYPAVPLSLNTIKDGLTRLEDAGLISVSTERKGQALMMAITLE